MGSLSHSFEEMCNGHAIHAGFKLIELGVHIYMMYKDSHGRSLLPSSSTGDILSDVKLHREFKLADGNKDGKLSFQELIGLSRMNREMVRLFKKMDENNDNLSFQEFVRLSRPNSKMLKQIEDMNRSNDNLSFVKIAERSSKPSRQMLRLFIRMDKNKDNYISFHELGETSRQ